MNSQAKVANFIKEKKYNEAAEIFAKSPIFDYSSQNDLIKFESFEFFNKENKNPIFLRVLLNYISLINLIADQNLFPIQDILMKFCAKFTYEKLSEDTIKLILMAKSSTEVYNIYFEKGKDIFKDCQYEIDKIDEEEDDKKGVGYTFQELGRIFVNDYVIGTNKGIELPNILFYIKSTEEIQKLLNNIITVPKGFKLNSNEIIDKSGVNEFDHIIKLNQDLTINESNPYFRYIKQIKTDEKNSPVKYGELVLKKDYIYILEFKTSFSINDDIARLQNLSEGYVKLYNVDQPSNNNEFGILYFYNNQENLGYKNFDGFHINLNLWRFLYINPSCQIVPVIKLSSEVEQLKKDFEEEKLKNAKLQEDFTKEKLKNQLFFSKINEKWRAKFNEDILEFNKSLNEKYLQSLIENSFQEKIKEIKSSKEFNKFQDLFKKYEKGMNEFITVDEKDKLEIDTNNKTYMKKFEKKIKD